MTGSLPDQPERGAGHVWPSLDAAAPEVDALPAFEAASLWRRTLAALLDLLVPFTAWALATWAVISSDPTPLAMPQWNLFDQVVDYLHDRPGRALASIALFVALQIAWPFAFAARTPGKRALGLALVTADGSPPSRLRTLGWAALRVPSILLAGMGVWWAIVDPERRTLHDRVAGIWAVAAKH